jgi:hypothetical protein
MAFKSNKTPQLFSRSTPSIMDKWNEQKDKLKKKFPNLTNNDLLYKEGKKHEMLENLRVKLNISIEDWKKILKNINA